MKEEIIEKIYDLYVTDRNKYLILHSQGWYETIIYKPMTQEEKKQRRRELYQKKKELAAMGFREPSMFIEKRPKPLLPYLFESHLDGRLTIGVFGNINSTKFICFDIDFKEPQKAKEAVYKLIEAIEQFGIPRDYIYVSSSGNKGYHLEIFFTSDVQFHDVELFFYTVLSLSKLDNSPDGKVELRPTAKQKNGVKIPLGCNFRNPDWRTQECWYCNTENNLEQIKEQEYILKIQKFPYTKFMTLMLIANMNAIEMGNINQQDYQKAKEAINKHKPLNIYKVNVDAESTIVKAKQLLQEGLKYPGTRHNSLVFLAKYLRYKGLSQGECEDELIKWMEKQDRQYYKSSYEECVKDIGLIVKYTYEREYKLIGTQEAKITKEEIESILALKQKNKMLVAYAILVHSKRYASEDGVFYMSYAQISKATGLCNKTAFSTVKSLVKAGFLEVVENNRGIFNKQSQTLTKAPNKYRVIVKKEETMVKTSYKVCDNSNQKSFYACLLYFYNEKELRKKVSRKFYNSIREFKEANNITAA